MMNNKGKTRHYNDAEKSFFLRILQKYSGTIENKKSDLTTLKGKDNAWNNIAEEFNASPISCEQRSVPQLKKWWSNIKQTQRNALTKEKQYVMATGGGPSAPKVDVDPEVTMVAPNLLTCPEPMFSSNMTAKDLEQKRKAAQISIEIDDVVEGENCCEHYEDTIFPDSDERGELSQTQKKIEKKTKPILPGLKKIKRTSSASTELKTKIRRLENVMEKELELLELKTQHECEIHGEIMAHISRKNELEIRSALAAAELAELLLEKEKYKVQL